MVVSENEEVNGRNKLVRFPRLTPAPSLYQCGSFGARVTLPIPVDIWKALSWLCPCLPLRHDLGAE